MTVNEESRPSGVVGRNQFSRLVGLQIYLPLAIFVLVVIGLTVTFGLVGVGDPSVWADVSLSLLVLPALILGLVVFSLIAVLVYGIVRVIQWLPDPAHKSQRFMAQLSDLVRQNADRAARPLMTIAGIGSVVVALGSIFRRRRG